jgi:CheY-like chemotaxis protein
MMDMQLPGMDGLSLVRQLKTNPKQAAIPIVAVSAHALPRDIEQAKSAGCLEYITKPITEDPFTFLERITRILLAGQQQSGIRNQEPGIRSQESTDPTLG